MRLRVLLASFLLLPIAQAIAQDSDPFYLEKRNDLGLVAYCSAHGMLPDDGYRFFKAGVDEIFGPRTNTPEGDLHERKGRDGIAYLQGEEQSIQEMAAAYDVDIAEVCGQYKVHISLGKIAASRRAK
ncbi:hypothetical protein [Aureimonas sp. AU20]|uniref:hypothetical protein n=1 Tax=Aureimonas sp. AU20 TaxID=1349819 RepID=UPI0007227865|nr:hypothetical protein [Aureimonas sp. AU20]ALN72570.1 hypothetical protein M673_07575 [Aureimonas sp. AU20]